MSSVHSPRVDVIAGARPNFMKIAPILHAIQKRQAAGSPLRYRLVHTMLRNETERPETVTTGTNELIGTTGERIAEGLDRLLA